MVPGTPKGGIVEPEVALPNPKAKLSGVLVTLRPPLIGIMAPAPGIPVTPVAPVAPVVPVAPVDPVPPVAPVGPVFPVTMQHESGFVSQHSSYLRFKVCNKQNPATAQQHAKAQDEEDELELELELEEEEDEEEELPEEVPGMISGGEVGETSSSSESESLSAEGKKPVIAFTLLLVHW